MELILWDSLVEDQGPDQGERVLRRRREGGRECRGEGEGIRVRREELRWTRWQTAPSLRGGLCEQPFHGPWAWAWACMGMGRAGQGRALHILESCGARPAIGSQPAASNASCSAWVGRQTCWLGSPARSTQRKFLHSTMYLPIHSTYSSWGSPTRSDAHRYPCCRGRWRPSWHLAAARSTWARYQEAKRHRGKEA